MSATAKLAQHWGRLRTYLAPNPIEVIDSLVRAKETPGLTEDELVGLPKGGIRDARILAVRNEKFKRVRNQSRLIRYKETAQMSQLRSNQQGYSFRQLFFQRAVFPFFISHLLGVLQVGFKNTGLFLRKRCVINIEVGFVVQTK